MSKPITITISITEILLKELLSHNNLHYKTVGNPEIILELDSNITPTKLRELSNWWNLRY